VIEGLRINKTRDMTKKDKEGRKVHARSTEVNTQKRGIPSPPTSKQNRGALCVHSKSEESEDGLDVSQSPEVIILEATDLTPLQVNLLAALEQSMGIVQTACDTLGISRTNHYKWMRESREYKMAYESLTNKALDYAESKLLELIGRGNTAAVIFYLKTKGKERGYVERQEVQVQQDTPDLSGYTTDQLIDLLNEPSKTEDQ
jgi:hypothetical protein